MASHRFAAGSIAFFAAVAVSPAVFRSTEVAAATVYRAPSAAESASGSFGPTTSTSTAPTTTSTEPTTTTSTTTITTRPPTTTTTSTTIRTTTSTQPAAAPPRQQAARPDRRSAESSPSRLQQIEAIADSSRWDWRRAGVVIHAQFHPEECCHWGVYDPRNNSLWIGPTAFANKQRLHYTVLHELGHAWQWSTGRLDQLKADMAPWGKRDLGAIEAGADCISVVWGASPRSGHYWACPPDAARLVARRLAGDWSP